MCPFTVYRCTNAFHPFSVYQAAPMFPIKWFLCLFPRILLLLPVLTFYLYIQGMNGDLSFLSSPDICYNP